MRMPGRAITVSEGGTAVAMSKILNYADLPVANIDMKGPDVQRPTSIRTPTVVSLAG